MENALDKISGKLTGWLDTFITNIPNIVLALLVFTVVIFTSRYMNKLIKKLLSKSKLLPSMQNLIAKLVAVLVILAGLVLILSILNLNQALTTLLTGAGVAGLAVGLALQGALANTYSGIILSYIKNIKFGDWVQSNGYEGEIINIDLRAVTIKQADNNMVYIPNKLVVENPIKNYSTTAQSRVLLDCGVGYETDLEFAKKLVVQTVSENFEAVESKDDVIFLYKEFADSSINFQVRFWINSTSGLEVAKAKSKAIILIQKAFDAHNINIPFPIRTLDLPKKIQLA